MDKDKCDKCVSNGTSICQKCSRNYKDLWKSREWIQTEDLTPPHDKEVTAKCRSALTGIEYQVRAVFLQALKEPIRYCQSCVGYSEREPQSGKLYYAKGWYEKLIVSNTVEYIPIPDKVIEWTVIK